VVVTDQGAHSNRLARISGINLDTVDEHNEDVYCTSCSPRPRCCTGS